MASHVWGTLTCVIPEKGNNVPDSNLLEAAVPHSIAVAASGMRSVGPCRGNARWAELEGAVVAEWALRWWLRD